MILAQLPMLSPPPEFTEEVSMDLSPLGYAIAIGTIICTVIAVAVFILDERRNRK